MNGVAVPGSWGGAAVKGVAWGCKPWWIREGMVGTWGRDREEHWGQSLEKVLEASSGVGKAGAAGVSPGTEVRRSKCSQWGDKKLGGLPGSRAPGGAVRGGAVALASQGKRWRWGQGRGRDKGRGEWGQLVTQEADQGAAGPGWAEVGQQEGPAGPGTASRLGPSLGLREGRQGLVRGGAEAFRAGLWADGQLMSQDSGQQASSLSDSLYWLAMLRLPSPFFPQQRSKGKCPPPSISAMQPQLHPGRGGYLREPRGPGKATEALLGTEGVQLTHPSPLH